MEIGIIADTHSLLRKEVEDRCGWDTKPDEIMNH